MLRNLMSRVVEIVTSEMPETSKSVRRGKRNAPYHRGLHLESLENRELLSVNWSQLQSLYADLNLSDEANYNVIEIQAANLSEASLRAAILAAADSTVATEAAGGLKANDVIVLRTTADNNKITLGGTELTINLNVETYGSVTIVSLSDSSNKSLTIDANQASRVMSVTSSTVAFGGLTITGGETTSNSSGGGIYSSASTLTVTNSAISGNTAGYGGGIRNTGTGSSLTVTRSTISGNTVSTSGGGIYNDGGTLTISNSTISGNTATTSTSVGGGGIYNGGTLTITNSTISDNTASSAAYYVSTSAGGGIYNGGTLTVTNSTISGNTASANATIVTANGTASGGGIYNDDGAMMITNSTISGNTASANANNFTSSGGGIYNNSGTLTLKDSIVALNYSLVDGVNIYGTLSDTSSNNFIDYNPWFVNGAVFDKDGKLINAEALDLNLTEYSPTAVVGKGSTQTYDGPYNQDLPLNYSIVTTLNDVFDLTDGVVSLREAIWAAREYDTITFAVAGTIKLNGQLLVDKAVKIDGKEKITLNGQQKTRVILHSVTDFTSTTELAGLVITGGKVIGGNSGGGIYSSGTLTISNSTISGNTATTSTSVGGGGIYNGGTLTITNSTISDNTSYHDGGGIYSAGMLTITNSTISGNTVSTSGGGIYNDGGTLTITNSSITGNTAGGGGGIANYSGTLTVTNSTISDNTAGGGGGIANGGTLTVTNSTISGNTVSTNGGGIHSYGTLTITNSSITGNTASSTADDFSTSFGGGIYNSGTLTVTNSTISGNTADCGGGINNYLYHNGYDYSDTTLTVTNSTISGNTALIGGGINNEYGTLTVTNSTISGNTASWGGGGISNYTYYDGDDYYGTLTLNNTIVAKNSTDIEIYVEDEYGGTITGSNNLIGNGANQPFVNGENGNIVGTAENPIDPKFVKIPTVIGANNTGSNYNPNDWDLRLTSASPAIDKGNNTYAKNPDGSDILKDLAGNARISGSAVDIGAYEYTPVSISSVTINNTSPKVGDTLTATPNPADATNVTYAWYYSDALTTSIGSEKTYVVKPADASKMLIVIATGDNSSSAPSAATSVVIAAVNLTGVNITGTAQVGQTLTANPQPATATNVAYAWYYSDALTTSIGSEKTYVVKPADASKMLIVIATGDNSSTATSAATNAVTEVTKLATPNIIEATTYAISTTSLQVTWGNVSGAAYYVVEYTTGSGTSKVTTTGVVTATGDAEQKVVLIGLKANSAYSITVTAKADGVESSEQSEPVTKSTAKAVLAAPKIAKIDVKKADVVTATSIKISWGKVANAEGYKVEYLVDGEWKVFVEKTIELTSTINVLSAGTTYSFRVTAIGNEKTENPTTVYASSVASVVQSAATTATGVTFKSLRLLSIVSNSTMELEWYGLIAGPENVTGYVIQVCLKSDFKTLVSTQTVLASEVDPEDGCLFAVLTNLTAEKEYYVHIKAVGTGYESAWQTQATDAAGVDGYDLFNKSPDTIELQPPVLNAATGLKATATATEMTISWGKVANADKYEYTVTTKGGSVIVPATQISGTSVKLSSAKISGLQPNTEYVVTVKALAKSGQTVYTSSEDISRVVYRTILAPVAAKTFTVTPATLKVPVEAGKPVELKVTWENPYGSSDTKIAGYIIEWATDAKFASNVRSQEVDASTFEYKISDLLANTKYSVRIKAIGAVTVGSSRDATGDSAWLAKTNVTTAKQQLAAPVLKTISMDDVNDTSMTVRWDWTPALNTTGNGFKVFCLDKTIPTAKPKSVTVKAGETSALLKSLKAGTEYQVWVVAVGKGNNADSAESNKDTATTRSAAPTGLGLTVTGTTITAKWKAAVAGNGYEVRYRAKVDGGWGNWGEAQKAGDNSTYMFAGTATTEYEVQVRVAGVSEVTAGSWCAAKKITTKTTPTQATLAFDFASPGGQRHAVDVENGKVSIKWNLGGYDMSQLSNIKITFKVEGTGQYKGHETQGSTITGTFKTDPLVVTRGDGDTFDMVLSSKVLNPPVTDTASLAITVDDSGTFGWILVSDLQSIFAKTNTGNVVTNVTVTKIEAKIDGGNLETIWSGTLKKTDTYPVW